MDGILNINKPQDLTSFSVVAMVKRISGERHTGHAGTLDPLATGVLPVCLGQATRVIEYLFDEKKTYRAQIELGIVTDTYDSTGKIIRTGDTSGITREMVESALAGFRGTILQVPPMYSAIKYHGKPLYTLARSGIEIERKPRKAQIYSLDIIDWQSPVVTLDIVCGKGTYIRSLAHELGEALGCGAHMKGLIRLRVGPFSVENALTLPCLEEAFRCGYGEKYLYPADFVLSSFNALVINQEQQRLMIHGMPIAAAEFSLTASAVFSPNERCRVYTEDGSFLGMARYDAEKSRWQPEKVFLKDIPGC
jgi:tRNA pseudouridine55 synthase